MIENENICHQQSFKAIDFILSAPQDELSRFNIRARWASSYWTPQTGIKFLHILGISENPAINRAVYKENLQYQDIIQVNFIDSYNNLTLKTLSILHWTKKNCKNVQWIIKSDSDVFINVFLMPK